MIEVVAYPGGVRYSMLYEMVRKMKEWDDMRILCPGPRVRFPNSIFRG